MYQVESEFLLGLLKIILINIVLSGDNAVVIALACRNLPAEQEESGHLGKLRCDSGCA